MVGEQARVPRVRLMSHIVLRIRTYRKGDLSY